MYSYGAKANELTLLDGGKIKINALDEVVSTGPETFLSFLGGC